MDKWSMLSLSPENISNIEADCYWCLQFAFRLFNCLLIREIPFHLVTRLWDTYLAEGDALPEFLVFIVAAPELDVSSIIEDLLQLLSYYATFAIYHQNLQDIEAFGAGISLDLKPPAADVAAIKERLF
ncbi:uncharacterized protein A4U43_C08F2150 [Asparagus officinalis]|nr:uncharacterized protein A4U43_C08F2150 [Asparagus officinalis]